MNNVKARMEIAKTKIYFNVKGYDIANEIGIADTSLNRWLERDLDPGKENRIMLACERIAERHNDK